MLCEATCIHIYVKNVFVTCATMQNHYFQHTEAKVCKVLQTVLQFQNVNVNLDITVIFTLILI